MVRSGSAAAHYGNILTCVAGKFGGKFVIVEQIKVYTYDERFQALNKLRSSMDFGVTFATKNNKNNKIRESRDFALSNFR